MATKREQFLDDGYLLYESVVPPDLCARSEEIINATTLSANFTWADSVAAEFRAWCQQFLESEQIGLAGWESDIHIFNRRPGLDPQFWHNDDQAVAVGLPFASLSVHRVFVCSYFVPTFDGRAPLRIIPGSHKGGYEDLVQRMYEFRLKSSKVEPHYKEGEDILLNYKQLFEPHQDQKVFEVPAGSVIVVSERMLHGTGINTYPARRPMALWWLELQ